MANKTGLMKDSESVKGFSAKCEGCGSENVSIEYEFNYYGGYTGYDQSLWIACRDCKSQTDLGI